MITVSEATECVACDYSLRSCQHTCGNMILSGWAVVDQDGTDIYPYLPAKTLKEVAAARLGGAK